MYVAVVAGLAATACTVPVATTAAMASRCVTNTERDTRYTVLFMSVCPVSTLGMNIGSELPVWIENLTIEQKYSLLSPSKNGVFLFSSNLSCGAMALLFRLLLTTSKSR